MGRVGRRPTGTIEAATGERIVAFGRAGKPPENPFFGPIFPPASRSRETLKSGVFRNGFLSRMA
jgi:hypothetical protein